MEDQAEYKTEIDDAMEMMGAGYDNNQPAAIIDSPRKVVALGENGLFEYQVWGWVKMSAKFISHIRKLKGAKLAIWNVIALSINGFGECDLSATDIAKLTGYSESETRETIRELDGMGYLTVTRRAGRKSIYKPAFAARSSNNPTEETYQPLQKSDPSRKATPPVILEGYPSSPSLETRTPSIKSIKEVIVVSESDIFTKYTQEFGAITPMISDTIGDDIDDYTPEWVLEAMQIAVESNKRNWKYVQGILKNCKDQMVRPSLSRRFYGGKKPPEKTETPLEKMVKELENHAVTS